MLGDTERAAAYASEQRRLVRDAVAAEVLTFTPYWREAAAEAGLRRPGSASDLQGLPPRPLDALGPPEDLVLRPSVEAVRKSGPKPLRRRLRRTRMRRGGAMAGRRILDPLYKAIHWIIEDETPVGCTEADLVRLAEVGRRSLEMAGVTPNDAIVGLVPPGPSLSAWQLALGAREAGVPMAGLSPSASLAAVALLGPTALAGRPPDLLRVLGGLDDDVRTSIVTVLAVTRSPLRQEERARLAAAAGKQASVVALWSPPGVRALWTQCRGGEGVHTWPQSELLEVCGPDGAPVAPGEPGELVWTGLGWRGTVLVRLATGVRGRLVEGPCPTCGRTTSRILDARPVGGGRRAERAEPLAEPAGAEASGEPARSERPSRKDKAEARGRRRRRKGDKGDRSSTAAGPLDDPVEAVRTLPRNEPVPGPAEDHPSEAVLAAPPEDAPGTVRAVAKDAEPDAPAAPPPPAVRAASAIGAVGHLPPVPEVGPDAVGDDLPEDGNQPWLPDTGEVDAWPAPVLASVEGLAAWQVEHRRRRGHDELVVHLALAEGAELGEVLVSLERSIGATQYVVGDEADVAARVAAADGRRVVDRRERRNGNGRVGSIASARGSAREG